MLLKRIKIKNYKSHSNTNIDFKNGLVGIVGKNGAGKSTIFDAIFYCLYGKDSNSKSLIKSEYAGPKENIKIEMLFEVASKDYKVVREFKGKALTAKAELYLGHKLIAKDSSPVNEEVANILNLERDAFKRSVFSGQKELAELSETTGESRKKMIRKMVGLEKLDLLQIEVNSDINSFKNQIIGQTANLLSEEELDSLEDEKKTVSEKLEEERKTLEREKLIFEKKREEYLSAKKIFDDEQIKYNNSVSIQNELASNNSKLEQLRIKENEFTEKKNRLDEIKIEVESQKGMIDEFENEKLEYSELEIVHKKILNRNYYSNRKKQNEEELKRRKGDKLRLEEQLKFLTVNEESLNHLKKNKTDAAVKHNEIQAQVKELEKKKNVINGKIQDRNEKVEKLKNIGRSGRCPTCHQPILLVYDKTLKTLIEEISEYENDHLNDLKGKIKNLSNQQKNENELYHKYDEEIREAEKKLVKREGLENNIQQLDSAIANYNEAIEKDELETQRFGNLKLDRQRFGSLEKKIKDFERSYIEYQQKKNHVENELPTTIQNIEKCKSNLLQTLERINELENGFKAISFDMEVYEKSIEMKDIKEVELQEYRDFLHEREIKFKETEQRLEKLNLRIQNHFDILKQIEEKKGDINVIEKLSGLIKGFKTSILDKISPSISKEASLLFNRITKGKYESIKVDRNFDFLIMDGGKYYPIQRFSGGEKDLANLCLRIAITKAIAELSGSNSTLDYLAFDEIFGSQDDERRHEIMLALDLLQEQFRQIYIVSHVDTIKDYFPNILEVTNGINGSEVNWI